METILLKAKNRQVKAMGFVDVHYSYDKSKHDIPKNSSFGSLISIKEFNMKPGMGFLPHKHRDIELITIPLSGNLEQKTSKGETFLVKQGNIHLMSSGSGITHFEYNKSQNNTLNCIQLEIKPKSTDEKPRSKVLNLTSKKNLLQNIISPKNKEATSSSMYQDFYFYYGFFNEDFKEKYRVKNPKSGLLILNVSGEIQVNDQKLQDKDTLVIRNSSTITIVSKKQSKFFLIEL